MRSSGRGALSALLVGALLASATPAAAQTYPPSGSELEVSTTEVTGGEDVVLRAGGFRARADVTIALRSVGGLASVVPAAAPTVLDVVAADACGTIETAVEIPVDTPPGEAVLEARGPAADGGLRVVSAVIEIAAAVERVPGEREEPAAAREAPTPSVLSIAMVLAAVLALAATVFAVRHATRRRETDS